MTTTPSSKSSVAAGSTSGSRAAVSASGVYSAEMLSPGSTNFPPVYEAAILYAADSCDAAEQVLKEHLATNDGKNSIRAWLSIFDFYQLTNNRREFDGLSMAFTVKFERSPPNWPDSADGADPRRREKRERKDLFVVTPTEDGAILPEIDRFEAFSMQMGSARLDFSKVKYLLAVEAELFTIVLQRIRKAKIPLWFNSLDEFVVQLKRGINEKTAQPLEESQGFWSMLFELYILDGRLQEYEDLGLEYAIAFEMSPPAWEAVTRPTGSEDKTVADASSEKNTALPIGFPIRGVVSQASREMLQQLAVYASGRQEVAIDMSGVLRIDFAAAGLFFDAIRAIHLSQKRVVLSNLNELVAALLEVFGMSKHAIIMRKKSF